MLSLGAVRAGASQRRPVQDVSINTHHTRLPHRLRRREAARRQARRARTASTYWTGLRWEAPALTAPNASIVDVAAYAGGVVGEAGRPLPAARPRRILGVTV